MEKYELSFDDVVKEGFKSGWFQGENFKNGTFITYNKEKNEASVYYFSENEFSEKYLMPFTVNKSLVSQKYRRVYTQSEIMGTC